MPKRQNKEFYEVSEEETRYYMNFNVYEHTSQNNNNINKHTNKIPTHQQTTSLLGVSRDRRAHDHLSPTTAAAFNYESSVESVAGHDGQIAKTKTRTRENRHIDYDCQSPPPPPPIADHAYENYPFGSFAASKELLLQKYFHSTERNYADYANLCRGCGYGVFEARGQLCNFCECIVRGGVVSPPLAVYDSCEEPLIGANIYENICDKCTAIYEGDECECGETVDELNRPRNDIEETVEQDFRPEVKCERSKSFTKRDKRSIFHGIIGSLKRVKSFSSSASSVATPADRTPESTATRSRKRPVILHNVDGYEHVFRTQETFDLQRICELKRTQNTSSSDQHIYGRLKGLPTTNTLPHHNHHQPIAPLPLSQSLSQDLLNHCVGNVSSGNVAIEASQSCDTLGYHEIKKPTKKPRLSRIRFLRSKAARPSVSPAPISPAPVKQEGKTSLFLDESVCHWMTALRREVHNYRCYGLPIDDQHFGVCIPKSIPAKNYVTAYCSEAPLACNTCKISNDDSDNCEEFVTLRRFEGVTDTDTSVTRENHRRAEDLARSPVEQMVYDFKLGVMKKHHQQQQQHQQRNNLDNDDVVEVEELLPGRRLQQNRVKRQAIYLKIDQNENNNNGDNNNSPSQSQQTGDVTCNIRQRPAPITTTTTTTTITNNADADADADEHDDLPSSSPCSNAQIAEAAAHLSALGELSPVSRRVARQAIRTHSRRCGIYERDSEFVNDILNTFETFLQRDASASADRGRDDVVTTINEQPQRFERIAIAETKPEVDDTCEAGSYHHHQGTEEPTDEGASVIETVGLIDDRQAGTDDANATDVERSPIVGDPQQSLTAQAEAQAPIKTSTNPFVVAVISSRSDSNSIAIPCGASSITCGGDSNGNSCLASLALVPSGGSQASEGEAYEQIFNVVQIIGNLLLSYGLHRIVVYYDPTLKGFLHCIYQQQRQQQKQRSVTDNKRTSDRLVRKFQRFHAYCRRRSLLRLRSIETKRNSFELAAAQSGPSLSILPSSVTHFSSVEVGASVCNDDSILTPAVAKVEAVDGSVCRDIVKDQSKRTSARIVVKFVKAISDEKREDDSEEIVRSERQVIVEAFNENLSERKIKTREFMESVDAQETQVDDKKQLETKSIESRDQKQAIERSNSSVKSSQRPRVPVRHPKTTLTTVPGVTRSASNASSTSITSQKPSSPLPTKHESPEVDGMTIPTANAGISSAPNNSSNTSGSSSGDHHNSSGGSANAVKLEDDIYQPIWQFKTVGEVQERYETDADYYEIGHHSRSAIIGEKAQYADDSSLLMSSMQDVEDHGEWETDDEFMFALPDESSSSSPPAMNGAGSGRGKIAPDACSNLSFNSSTIRSTTSTSSSSGVSGSTVTGFSSSTVTMASAQSVSLQHPLLRSVGIFYSLNDSRLRAIVYDYDRLQSPLYFAKPLREAEATADVAAAVDYNANNREPLNDSGIGKPSPSRRRLRSPMPLPAEASESREDGDNAAGGCHHHPQSSSAKVGTPSGPPVKLPLLPDSVQAWKFMLLDVNYLEDEEDMIVSEIEILRAQQIRDNGSDDAADSVTDVHSHQLSIMQRFKSASIGNLLEIPNDEDKKSIAERMRNKLQRGVFKLRSPKSDKKSRGIFRRTEATSLYLEEGLRPKYPIFGAPLDQLELNMTSYPHVPRFVVDCVAYIERKDCIQQDGLYRASGNKVAIDDLKAKLSESYIYDPKLLQCDDIHTLTSLFKLFFRELGEPLIPQETYDRLGKTLTDPASLETMRQQFADMREPNRSTLKFIVRHLTNVATYSSENRMPASNLAIVWGPCLLSANQIEFNISRMNTLAKVLIENYDFIFGCNERLL